ncbi:MAG: CsgG/HfaB family protein [Bacteroidota bacterium]
MCRSVVRVILVALLLGGATGCANYLEPFHVKPAHPGIPTRVQSELHRLPSPQEKVVVAVYRFRDQTGQYKAGDRIASWSTAVTQGSTSILMRALEESGWFVPIEREGLSNLLNERQIIQSIRAQHVGPDGEPLGPLPPLLYAGVVLEGGIIGYDTNVITGGAGVRYFGAGASGQFRQDQVTVYLRAVSTQSGRVMKTVYTTKTIVSQKVDAGLFRYVDPKRLLETEAGYTFNEPPVLAVTEAIEEAVKNLVIEGVRENMWALADPADARSEAFLAYDRSVAETDELSYFGRLSRPYRGGFAMGLSGGAQQYRGNYTAPLIRPVGEVTVQGRLSDRFFLDVSASGGEIGAEGGFSRATFAGDLMGTYFVLPDSPVSPFLTAGTGLIVQDWEQPLGDGLFPALVAGGGLEMMVSQRLGFRVGYRFRYALLDGLDGVKAGRLNDSMWSVQTGITYYTRLF